MAVSEEIVGVKPLTRAQNLTAYKAAECTAHRLWSQISGFPILPLLCMTLGKLLNHLVPKFPHWQHVETLTIHLSLF